jgi:hypothetical protein
VDIFSRIGVALFGRDKPTEIQDMFDGGVDVLTRSNPRANLAGFDYHFAVAPLPRKPGPAYISALLQFQEYPRNNVEGRATLVNPAGYFRPFEGAQTAIFNEATPSGTSGTITGSLGGQPLYDPTGIVS